MRPPHRHPATGTTIVDPIPEGTEYLPGSASSEAAAPEFSIDGGKSYGPEPIRYTAKDTSGAQVEKTAPPDMYTHIRWILKDPVPAGGNGVLEFKVRVE